MIFKHLRLTARFGKAHGLLLKKKYDKSYDLLMSILKAEPEESMLLLIHEDLGNVQYHRGNYAESMRHMEFCIQHSVENQEQWSEQSDMERLELIHWYFKASEEKL